MVVKVYFGRGGWSWYTGSSSWYYDAGIEYILGLKIKNENLTIEPCVPFEWDEYFIQYKYKESIYNVKIKNINKTNKVQKLLLNGELKEEKMVKLIDNKSERTLLRLSFMKNLYFDKSKDILEKTNNINRYLSKVKVGLELQELFEFLVSKINEEEKEKKYVRD